MISLLAVIKTNDLSTDWAMKTNYPSTDWVIKTSYLSIDWVTKNQLSIVWVIQKLYISWLDDKKYYIYIDLVINTNYLTTDQAIKTK